MEFETEEQQVEALKKWWKENGKQVIFGAIIGFSLIGGWRYYLDYSVKQTSEASALFEQMVAHNTASGNTTDKAAVFDKIKNNYAGTPYLSTSALLLAKTHYESGNKEKALEVLDTVIADNKQSVLALVAKERKARILIDMDKADEALVLLTANVEESFRAVFEELKGDAYLLKGDIAKARAAYDKALLLNNSGNKNLLQMKRDDLGYSVTGPAA